MAEVVQVPVGGRLAGAVGGAPSTGAVGVVPSTGAGQVVHRGRWPAAGPVVAAAAVCVLTGVVSWRDPFKHEVTPPCPFHELTGLWCPFCGGTRAVWAATHGDLRLMLHANALFPMIVVLFAWSWAAWLGKATSRWSIPVPRGRTFAIGVAVALVAFTVFRNLPGFGALAPPS